MGGFAGGMNNATSPGNLLVNTAAIAGAPFTGGLSLLAPPVVGAVSGGVHNGLPGALGGATMGTGMGLGGAYLAGALPMSGLTGLLGLSNPNSIGSSNLMGLSNPNITGLTDSSSNQFFNPFI